MTIRSRWRPVVNDMMAWSTQRKFIFAAKTTSIIAVSGVMAYYWPEIQFVGQTAHRTFRTTKAFVECTLDYKKHYPFEKDQPKTDSQQEPNHLRMIRQKRSEVHQRAADRLLRLFQTNGGIYIKLGQHMSALEHVLPLEYSSTMRVLQDKAPVSSTSDVAAVLREDLGMEIEDIFSEFDETPIGAASLAQVHRARLKSNGEEVAVKIQHHRLQAFVDMDLLIVSSAVKIVKYIFPQFEFAWLAEEMKTNLPKELDFQSEAHNAERLVKNLERTWPSKCPVHVPKLFWDYISKRVLVMEFCSGNKISDVESMIKARIRLKDVSAALTHLYGQMIFLHGFVHCDPHPGNILIKFDPDQRRKFRLILLDHGIYKELPDEFRMNYAHLWKSLVDGDEIGIRKYSEKLGGGDAYKLFSVVLTHRSWDTMVYHKDWDRMRKPMDIDSFRERASDYLPQVAELLARLPRPLLLLLKTNDLLRAIDRALQANNPDMPSKTFVIMGEYCVEAVNQQRLLMARGSLIMELRAIFANAKDRGLLIIRRIFFDIYTKLASVFGNFI